ncbi:MFS transporter [Streptomyces sp. BPTC-684]|uniref:MFS transporter n=1 Tax=Streptomyces sp. BPTC-684 TaxID=3043734 RepID=UPI0024B1F809|nr:MFS transporter [Streptomyces sp. BPTC-684]WHM35828.1 MFS transporter [Streptomyces sp. BPTC-684]
MRAQPAGGKLTDRAVVAVLCAGFFLLDFDLVVINPLLVPVSKDFDVSLGTTAFALTGYLAMVGIMQPVHGAISDRVGRVRVLRTALLGLGVADLAAALAPNAALLIAGRAIAGGFAAALIPVTVAYVGDHIPMERRQRTMAAVMSSSAVGAASATVVAGALTELLNWRSPLLIPAVAAPLLALVYARLPEAPRAKGAEGPSVRERFAQVLGDGWFRFFIPFTFVEGAAMMGLFNFFNAALQKHGSSVLMSGLVTSAYGVAAIGGSVVVRAVDARATGAGMFGWGTGLLFIGYLTAAFTQSIAGILIASALAGLALAVGQSALQAWILEAAAPEARGSATALIACSVFTGAAISTAAVGPLAGRGDFGLLFGIAAAATVPVAIVGTLARARFARSDRAQRMPAGPPVDQEAPNPLN